MSNFHKFEEEAELGSGSQEEKEEALLDLSPQQEEELQVEEVVEDKYGGPILESDGLKFENPTPFTYGAGHLHPNRVVDPGFIYNLTIFYYLTFL
ncbi:hypothetical protein TSUD_257340 [Trifolium subterraneum]|uniref:Uncharacterized protein n=1 Tax=Trifolium subterraneum TaxID=3900 RepID=A0A2Z6M7Y3_TRISU|nr:hypothetical protein TSUD_257340 [Trifolium subterraneum]